MSPLLLLTSRRPAKEPPRLDGPIADLWPALVLLWVASAARVALGFAAHEVFGAEGTLALACLVLLPWLLWNEARSGRSR